MSEVPLGERKYCFLCGAFGFPPTKKVFFSGGAEDPRQERLRPPSTRAFGPTRKKTVLVGGRPKAPHRKQYFLSSKGTSEIYNISIMF